MSRVNYNWPANQSKDTIEILVNNVWQKYHFQNLKISFETLASDNSGRTEDGVMHISYIRNKLVKLECSLPPIDNNGLSTWQPFFNATYGKTHIRVRYYDIHTKTGQDITCYCSNFNGDIYSGILYNGMWQGIKINLIEE